MTLVDDALHKLNIGTKSTTKTIAPNTDTPHYRAISAAADKWNVPIAVLVGVYGMETTFGADIRTSSAGAVGPFQFIPTTAARYHYPLTNTPTNAQFAQQADAAAHYLSDLHRQTGSWEKSLRAYSGGGYGFGDVLKKASGHVPTTITKVPWDPTAPAKAAASIPGAITSLANVISDIEKLLFSSSTWLRVGKVLVGVFLVLYGIMLLGKLNPNSLPPVKAAAAAAAI